MKKILLVSLIFSVLPLRAMEEPTGLSLKELAAKKLAEELAKQNKPVDYSKLPDSTAELVFRFINKNTFNFDELKNYFASKQDLSQSFAQYLAPLIQDAVFDVDFIALFTWLDELNIEIQRKLKKAFVNQYIKNTKKLSTMSKFVILTVAGKKMSLPLDSSLDFMAPRENLSLNGIVSLVFIQKIELEILSQIDSALVGIVSHRRMYLGKKLFSIDKNSELNIKNALRELEKLIDTFLKTDDARYEFLAKINNLELFFQVIGGNVEINYLLWVKKGYNI
jgi:hypothetical protein